LHKGGMKSSKMSKGGNASKKLGTTGLDTRLYFITVNFHSKQTSGQCQTQYEFSSIYTVHNV